MHQFSRTYSSASFKFVHFNQHSLVQVINNSSLFHKVTLFGLHIEVVVFSCSVVSSSLGLFVTPWTAACKASLSFTVSQMFIESVTRSNHLILCRVLSHATSNPRVYYVDYICKNTSRIQPLLVSSTATTLAQKPNTYYCHNILNVLPASPFSFICSLSIQEQDWLV